MVKVVRPCWISKLEPFNGMWYLSENGKPRGQFDAVVIAHNGSAVAIGFNNLLWRNSLRPLVSSHYGSFLMTTLKIRHQARADYKNLHNIIF